MRPYQHEIDYKQLLDFLPFDLSAEALVAILLEEHGWSLEKDQFIVHPQGRRGAMKTIADIQETYTAHEKKLLLQIKTTEDGLLDNLPTALFLAPMPDETDDHGSDTREKTYEEQIAEARQFLAPFDQAIFRAKLEIAHREHQFSKTLPDFIKGIWTFDITETPLEKHHKQALMQLMPIAPKVVGDTHKTALCLEALIGYRVKVATKTPPAYSMEQEQLLPLGNEYLGVDMVLGSQFYDGIPAWAIQVVDIEAEEIESFLNGYTKNLIEKIFIPYFTPVELEVSLNVEAAKSKDDFVLLSWGHTSILGYTTRL